MVQNVILREKVTLCIVEGFGVDISYLFSLAVIFF